MDRNELVVLVAQAIAAQFDAANPEQYADVSDLECACLDGHFSLIDVARAALKASEEK